MIEVVLVGISYFGFVESYFKLIIWFIIVFGLCF